MMLFVYIGALCIIITIIVIISWKFKASRFNKMVMAYSDRHVHKVLVNYAYNFIAVDINSLELTLIRPGKQITFTPDQIDKVNIVEKEDGDNDGPDTYTVYVLITLKDHPLKKIKINCFHLATRDSWIYNHGWNIAKSIDDAIENIKKGIV